MSRVSILMKIAHKWYVYVLYLFVIGTGNDKVKRHFSGKQCVPSYCYIPTYNTAVLTVFGHARRITINATTIEMTLRQNSIYSSQSKNCYNIVYNVVYRIKQYITI